MYLKTMHFPFILFIAIVVQSTSAEPNPSGGCDYQLVESLPEGLTYNQALPFEPIKTHQLFLNLISNARSSIQLASMYSTLTVQPPELADHPSTEPARQVLEALESAARDRKIKVEILLGSVPRVWSDREDIRRFTEAGIEVKFFNVTKVLGGGIQHAKYLITDEENLYIGSANLDWRAFTQVKEMGIAFTDCKPLASDLSKVFRTYTLLADDPAMLDKLPAELGTSITATNPMTLAMDQVPTQVFLSTAPHEFNTHDGHARTDDLQAILDMINQAKKYVYISVMRFRSAGPTFYWPTIENALRAAVIERKVMVKVLVSKWGKVLDYETACFKSLEGMKFEGPRKKARIEVRYFNVPSDEFQSKVPFARVKHDKYIVTDNGVYIGTSNWEENYFRNICGVGITIRPQQPSSPTTSSKKQPAAKIIEDMTSVFNRDYLSEYTESV